MAVFRIDKNKNYTVMSNYHLRDINLSCKACGLLSKMLSLPEEWDYTTRGLASICKDGVDSIGSALKELERCGYLVRNRIRDNRGRIKDTEYVIYETPHLPEPEPEVPDTPEPDPEEPDIASPDTACPYTEIPDVVEPDTELPCPEKPAQLSNNKLNTKQSITEKSNTKKSITNFPYSPSFIPSFSHSDPDNRQSAFQTVGGLERKDGRNERQAIREQIDYNSLVTPNNRAQLDELVELMLEVRMNRSPTIRFGRDAEYPTGYVQDRFRQITSEHIDKVLDGIHDNTTLVRNTKAYLMAALFNAVSTLDNHFTMRVNHDMYGG